MTFGVIDIYLLVFVRTHHCKSLFSEKNRHAGAARNSPDTQRQKTIVEKADDAQRTFLLRDSKACGRA
jgi:hypothetical protein